MQDLLGEIGGNLLHTAIEADSDGAVTLPMGYPGGAAVTVWVRQTDDSYLVSDRGIACREADQLGAAAAFADCAPQVARRHGVFCDGQQMFAADLARDGVANAVIFVAGASQAAVEWAADAIAY